MTPYSSVGVALFVIVIGFPMLNAQSVPQAGAAALIRQLNQQWANFNESVIFSCGRQEVQDRDNRLAAGMLADLGHSALPEIAEVLASVERRGRDSEWDTNSEWLLYADAAIEGSSAFPRLRRLSRDPRLLFLHSALETAISISLGLTSYVDALAPPTHGLCRGIEPRDALSQLVFAWEAGNKDGLDGILGANAKRSFGALVRGRSLATLQAGFLPKTGAEHLAGGFRFEAEGRWSKPAVVLSGEFQEERPLPLFDSIELATVWTNGSGRECGRSRVRFVSYDQLPGGSYRIDNPDLGELLHLISSCVSGAP